MYSKLSLNLISPRFGHESLLSSSSLSVLVFGGSNTDGFVKYVELINLKTLKVQKIQLKHPNCSENESQRINEEVFKGIAAFKMVSLNNNLDRVLIFGGINENKKFTNHLMFLKDFSSLKYIQVSGNIPSPRIGHSFTKINQNKIILFGGVNNFDVPRYLNDLYILHINDNLEAHWELIEINGSPPPPRESHSAVLYKDTQIIIFGGMNGKHRLNDTWILDIEKLTFIEAEVGDIYPTSRSLHSCSIINDEMFIFGGFVHNKLRTWSCTNSLECLNLKTMTWRAITGHSPKLPARASHTAFEHLGRIYFYAGRKDLPQGNVIEVLNDCWFIDTRPPPPVPNINLFFIGNDFIYIRWEKTPNTTCYLVEILEIVEKESPERDVTSVKVVVQPKVKIEPEPPKKAKIIIYSRIPQVDGADDDDNEQKLEESDTESERETNNEGAMNKWCIVKTVIGDEKLIIRSYQDFSIDRKTITSEKIPKKFFNQIPIMPKKKYSIRVNSLNACGISDAKIVLSLKTSSIPPLNCLKLDPVITGRYYNFSWMTSTPLPANFFFTVVLIRVLPCSKISNIIIYEGKKSSCIIAKEAFDFRGEVILEFILRVNIISEGHVKIAESDLRWRA